MAADINWLDEEFDPLDPLGQQRALAARVRRSPAITMPSSAVETPPPGRTSSADYQRQIAEMIRQRPDEAPLIAEAKRRGAGSQRDLQAAMALQALGGETLRPFGAQVMSRALKGGEDFDIPGGWGTVSPQGVTWNPAKQKEADLQHLQFLAGLSEREQSREELLAERRRANLAAEQDRRETRTFRQAQLSQGKFQAVKDAEGNVHLFNTVTGKFEEPGAGGRGAAPAPPEGAPGARRFPAQQSPKASEGERNTAYQTEAIAGRQENVDPAFASPGAWEALARTVIPGEMGEGIANFLSPTKRQITRGAQEGTVDALLFLATGAAYNKEQLTQAKREFLPNYTDSEETVQAKRRRVAELALAARNRAGRAWTQAQEDKLIAAFPEIADLLNPGEGGGTPAPAAPRAGGLPRAGAPGRARDYLEGRR